MRLDEAKKILNVDPAEEKTLEPEEFAKVSARAMRTRRRC
jgi:hypothetical protein